MKKLFLTLPENLSSAVGFTLLHSLWQGAVLLLVFAGMHFFLKTARSRYLLGMGTLLSQTVLSVLTFWWIYTPASALAMDTAVNHSTALLPAELLGTDSQTLLHTVQRYIAENHQKFTLLWILGVGILLTRMCIGLIYTRHLKTAGIKGASADYQTMMSDQAHAMGLQESIRLFESLKVSSPLTIGWLKPVILFPVGMLNGLSTAQVEAILAHELAHIMRRDYLWNIVQNAIETIFFFHPAVWAISHRVRIERENACDDIALTYCKNKLVLAHALAEVATFQTKPMFAMAFGARKYTLLDRVKRIVGMDEKQALTTGNWISLTVLLSLCMGAWTYAQEPGKPKVSPVSPQIPLAPVVVEPAAPALPAVAPRDTFPKTETELAMDRLSKEMSVLSEEMSKYGEKMSMLGKKMHNPEMEKLSAEMATLSEKMSVPSAKLGSVAEKVSILSLEVALKKMKKEDTATLEKELKEKEEELEKLNKEMEVISSQMNAIGKKMDESQKPIDDIGRQMNLLNTPMDSLGKLMGIRGEEMGKLGEQLEIEHRERAIALSKELVKERFVTDQENYYIKIDKEFTTINERKLTEEESLRLLQIIKKHFRFSNNYDTLYIKARDGHSTFDIFRTK
jgi:bla regulator protein BlaR1